jgi:hypothetical protein
LAPRKHTELNLVEETLRSSHERRYYCDVLLTSTPNHQPPFQLTIHKNVMAGIPYFENLYTSGLKESMQNDNQMVKLVLPFDMTETTCREFVYYAYMDTIDRIEMMNPHQLMQLLKLRDYYQFEDMLEVIQDELLHSYGDLTPKMALELLTLVQRL